MAAYSYRVVKAARIRAMVRALPAALAWLGASAAAQDISEHEYFSDLIDLKDYTKLLPDLFYFKDLKNAKNSSVIEELEKMYPMAETEFK